MPKRIYVTPPNPNNFHNFGSSNKPNTSAFSLAKANTSQKIKKGSKIFINDKKITDYFTYNGTSKAAEVLYLDDYKRGYNKRVTAKTKEIILKPANLIEFWNYSDDYQIELDNMKDQMQKLSAFQLKQILQINGQSFRDTITKDYLVKRVADGNLNGKIPKCSICQEGSPYFDHKTGLYKCRGYKNEFGQSNKCSAKLVYSQLVREDFKYIIYEDEDQFSKNDKENFKQLKLEQVNPFNKILEKRLEGQDFGQIQKAEMIR